MTTYAAALLDKARLTCSPANYSALALRLGVSRQSVSSWRNGLTPLPEDRVRELSRMAHVDDAEWWLAIQSDHAPEPMKARLRTVLHRAGIAALLAIQCTSAVASISHMTADGAYYVRRLVRSVTRCRPIQVLGTLLALWCRALTRTRHGPMLALQG